jgi:serine/threonine-protein kinase
MLMEHLAGEDLKEVLRARGVLPLDEAALYVYQACEAVAEAHSHGIVHRDLKPANMFLIRRPNGTPCVKVLDFGISKEMDSANKLGPDLTKTGTFMGSPFYMSPEHMANIKTTEPRSDIWALGVILYEFATGSKPFVAEAMTELVTKVLTAQPSPPSMVRPGIPPEFDAIVLRCLEKNREHRFASVRDLMTALQPFTTPSTVQYTVLGVQPAIAPRPEMKSNAGTVLLPNRPGVEGTDVPLPTPANAREQQPDPAIATIPANNVAILARGSHTGGAWANTSSALPRTNKRAFVVASGAAGAVVLIGMGIFLATRTTTTLPAGASAAAVVVPPAVAETAVPQKASVTPIPELAQSAAVSNSAVPTTTTPPSQTAAAPTTTTAPSPTSRPASTSTKKKPVIADFDN